MIRSLALLILFASSVAAQTPSSPPKITFATKPVLVKPVERQASVGELVRLVSDSPESVWSVSPESPGGDIEPGLGGKAFFSAEKPGRYVLVNSVGKLPVAWVVVAVGGAKPPVKPDDPKPDSPVADPVTEAIRKAYETDAGKPYEKKQWAANLAGVWAAGVDHAANEKVTTPKQLIAQIRSVIGKELLPDNLSETRKAIGGETARLFPSPDEPLTAGSRKSAAALFMKISKTLEELSK